MARTYNDLTPPADGGEIAWHAEQDRLEVPDRPIIPFIEGDGTGPDIWRATRRVLDGALEKVYGGARSIAWFEVLAGEKAYNHKQEWLPADTIEAIRTYRVAIKGPLTTPVGGGIRSLNVALRQILDLYACVRPVRYLQGVPSPVREPEKVDMVIYRENTEDVYAGIEWPAGSDTAKKLIELIGDLGKVIRPDSGIGIKPISEFGSKRLVRKALRYAVDFRRKSVTLVHKGNIMKFTEGAFKDWGYDVARESFADVTVTETDLWDKYDGKAPDGRIVVKDRIADSMFQQALLRPDEYDVLATTNLNGDYLSDALAAQVGGLGMAPGSNEGDGYAVFEATHGTAPKYAGKDYVNPGSEILSAEMMLVHMGWKEAAALVTASLEKAILDKVVTYDFARLMPGARQVSCSAFGAAMIERM